MKRRGMDQTAAWIGAVMFTGSVFFAGYYATDYLVVDEVFEDVPAEEKPQPSKSPDENEGGMAARTLIDPKGNDPFAGDSPKHAAIDPATTAPSKQASKSNPLNTRWSYKGAAGPMYWAELDRANIACSAGKHQSPIDIDKAFRSKKLSPIEFHYKTSRGDFINNGHTLQVDYEPGSYITVDDVRYDLMEFHFHAPSEHKVEGIPYDMEMHLVHKSNTGRLAVVGVLVEEGPRKNHTLGKFWGNLPRQNEMPVRITQFNVKKMLPKSKNYFHYMGSLTTPPCSEGVNWYVMTTPITFSARQIDDFIRVVKFNARPVQPLFSRQLQKTWESY